MDAQRTRTPNVLRAIVAEPRKTNRPTAPNRAPLVTWSARELVTPDGIRAITSGDYIDTKKALRRSR